MTYNLIMSLFKRFAFIITVSLFMAALAAAPGPAPGTGPVTGSKGPEGNPPPPGPPPSKNPPPAPPSPKNPDSMMYYRGMRTAQQDIPLSITQTKASRVSFDKVELEIIFNQSINPRSVKNTCITINGEELPKSTKFAFNKKGDTIKFEAEVQSNFCELALQKIRSFDGRLISPVKLSLEIQEEKE